MNSILLNDFKINNKFNTKNTAISQEKHEEKIKNSNYQNNLVSLKGAEAIKARNLSGISFGKIPFDINKTEKIITELEQNTYNFYRLDRKRNLFITPSIALSDIEILNKIPESMAIDLDKGILPAFLDKMKEYKNVAFHHISFDPYIIKNFELPEYRRSLETKEYKEKLEKVFELIDSKSNTDIVVVGCEHSTADFIAIMYKLLKEKKLTNEVHKEILELRKKQGDFTYFPSTFVMDDWLKMFNSKPTPKAKNSFEEFKPHKKVRIK